jgi:amino acid transporter
VLIVLIASAFFFMPYLAYTDAQQPFCWGALLDQADQFAWGGSSLAVLLGTICFNFQGWTQLANVMDDVRNPSHNIPLGLGLALVAIIANYAVPLALTIPLTPATGNMVDFEEWDTGYIVIIGQRVRPWLGHWTTICAILATFNFFSPPST